MDGVAAVEEAVVGMCFGSVLPASLTAFGDSRDVSGFTDSCYVKWTQSIIRKDANKRKETATTL